MLGTNSLHNRDTIARYTVYDFRKLCIEFASFSIHAQDTLLCVHFSGRFLAFSAQKNVKLD